MVTQLPDGAMQFEFYRPNADRVSVAGEFNGWRPGCLRMNRSADGWWRCTMRLAPGFYQFRYVADGDWYTDYASFGLEPTPFGFNSVLNVAPPAVLKQQPATADPDARQAA